MLLAKRDCYEYIDGEVRCDGFWYSDTGIIVKWSILSAIFGFFILWFVGGYMHAKRRMKKGLPLLAYHRWLIPRHARPNHPYASHHQQPQNHFTFYNPQATPYTYPPNSNSPFPTPSPDAPPPLYTNDAPPSYFGPQPGSKGQVYQQGGQHGQQGGVEMPMYGVAGQTTGGQQMGVVGGGRDVEHGLGQQPGQQGQQTQYQDPELPPRPAQARVALGKVLGRFRR